MRGHDSFYCALTPGQRELVGVFRRAIAFYPHPSADGGKLVGALAGGEVVRGTVNDPEDLRVGQAYRFYGQTDDHEKFGLQFCFDLFVPHLLPSESATINYLVNHAEHVGRVTASKLWKQFGPDAVAVLTHSPKRVVEAGIMTADAATAASAS